MCDFSFIFLTKSLSTQGHCTTVYHPQANGLCECFHKLLKAALCAVFSDCTWVDLLPWVMLELRSVPKEDLDALPAELVFRQPLHVSGEFLPEGSYPSSFPVVRPFLSDSTFTLPPVRHCSPRLFAPAELATSHFITFIDNDHHSPLQPCMMANLGCWRRTPKILCWTLGVIGSTSYWAVGSWHIWRRANFCYRPRSPVRSVPLPRLFMCPLVLFVQICRVLLIVFLLFVNSLQF